MLSTVGDAFGQLLRDNCSRVDRVLTNSWSRLDSPLTYEWSNCIDKAKKKKIKHQQNIGEVALKYW